MTVTLEELRSSIDNIDNAIVAMLAERFKVTNKVGHYKAENNLPAQDVGREQQQYERMQALAFQYGLDPEFAQHFLSVIVTQVVENHKEIAQEVARS
ncbi:chorismate mutase [Marinomonas transparens]|uniref:chorismate mutase n=1 Tax=Marinomonas transparens TaxID=2795388 RepID=A0A934JJJ5_9GAMM|nr:chorismate mutase [Marinomonas transparens]MBJ7537270.1 chorismate mutase [Marinomonas transparens]